MKKPLQDQPNPTPELDAILQASTDLNFVLDADGQILDYNTGPFLSGPFPKLAHNQKIQELLPPELVEKFEAALHSSSGARNVNAFEFNLSISDRSYWFESRLVPVSGGRLIFTARDITQCKETESRLKRQMQQLSALRSIDLAIASGLDLNLLLSMLLDQVSNLLQINAVAILLWNPRSNQLEFTADKGFRSKSLQYTRLKLGDGCAGRVALERRMLNIPDLRENHVGFDRSPLFRNEDFIAYYGVPLMAKGRLLGVMELFHRSLLHPDSDWLNFLGMLAGQAAIAIDNAMMFKEIQRSNLELSLAYDATIEGFSRALDLRDRETEEHTRRVTDITVKMAVRLGVDESEIVHLRRGAILHDVGKVAIPDHILFKPGPLADDEWIIMRRHPIIAVELLSPVSYLEPALTIPHWHHEKWDGSGYPDRLGAEEIPFHARMFALVDVYDALTSDRPYRAAWSKQDTIHYIKSQSGRHFDPKLVPEFLHMVSGNGF